MEDQQIKSRPRLVNSHKFEESSSSIMQKRAQIKAEENKGTNARMISKKKLNLNVTIGS